MVRSIRRFIRLTGSEEINNIINGHILSLLVIYFMQKMEHLPAIKDVPQLNKTLIMKGTVTILLNK